VFSRPAVEAPPAHLVESVNRVKERRKRKENPSQPVSQLPGWRKEKPAPRTKERGIIQKKSRLKR
jgi:hypothetical protein